MHGVRVMDANASQIIHHGVPGPATVMQHAVWPSGGEDKRKGMRADKKKKKKTDLAASSPLRKLHKKLPEELE